MGGEEIKAKPLISEPNLIESVKEFVPDPDADNPYAGMPDQEDVEVAGITWVFQHLPAPMMKKLERQARNKRTGNTDSGRLSQLLYEHVVVGKRNKSGQFVPKRPPYGDLQDCVVNEFDDKLMSFLRYTG